jgi:hypothetical protein
LANEVTDDLTSCSSKLAKRIFVSFGSALQGIFNYLQQLEEARAKDWTCSSGGYSSKPRFHEVLGVVALDPPVQVLDWTSPFSVAFTSIPFLVIFWRDDESGPLIHKWLVRNPYAISVIIPERSSSPLDENKNGYRIEIPQSKSSTIAPLEEIVHGQLWSARTIVKYIDAVYSATSRCARETQQQQHIDSEVGKVKARSKL